MAPPFLIDRRHVLTWAAYQQLGGDQRWLGTWAIYPKVEPYIAQCTVAGETLEESFPSETDAESAAFEAGTEWLERLKNDISA
jgi:hypothetical protein